MSDMKRELSEHDDLYAIDDTGDDIELFAEELEDRFNAKVGSSAATVASGGSCISTFSSFCSEM